MDRNPDVLDVAVGALDALPQAIAEWRAALRKVSAHANTHDRKAAAGAADDALKAARKVNNIMASAYDATQKVRDALPATPPANAWAAPSANRATA